MNRKKTGRVPLTDGVGAWVGQLEELGFLDAASLLTIHDFVEVIPSADKAAVSEILAVMFAGLSAGGICVQSASLTAAAKRYAGSGCGAGLPDGKSAVRMLGPLLTPAGSAPLVFQKETGLLFFQRYAAAHERMEGALRRFVDAGGVAYDSDRLVDAVQEVVHKAPMLRPDGGPVELSSDQITALAVGLLSNPAVITGGPGTGKTSIVLVLLRILMRLGVSPNRVRVAAPTGRAARRIAESLALGLAQLQSPGPLDQAVLNVKADTLHQLLGYRPRTHDFIHGSALPLDADVIIVDESSMVDVLLMSHLLTAVDASRTRLILLGDRDQLPSVDAGAVLSDLVTPLLPDGRRPSYTDKFVRQAKAVFGIDLPVEKAERGFVDRIAVLTTSHRSADDVLSLARWINEPAGPPPALMKSAADVLPRRGAFLMEGEVEGPVRAWLEDILKSGLHEDLRALSALMPGDQDAADKMKAVFRGLHDRRVLCVTREGRRGVTGLNKLGASVFREHLRSDFPQGRIPEPILILRNDRERGLSNGDPGVVAVFADGQARAFFADGRIFPVESLPEYESAFAMTVHKSQGSEYAAVLLVLPDDPSHPLLTRELLYTGVTRAKSLIAVLGSRENLAAGAARKIERETGSFLSIL